MRVSRNCDDNHYLLMMLVMKGNDKVVISVIMFLLTLFESPHCRREGLFVILIDMTCRVGLLNNKGQWWAISHCDSRVYCWWDMRMSNETGDEEESSQMQWLEVKRDHVLFSCRRLIRSPVKVHFLPDSVSASSTNQSHWWNYTPEECSVGRGRWWWKRKKVASSHGLPISSFRFHV